jgi:K+-transporting ATPase KdpF subunit
VEGAPKLDGLETGGAGYAIYWNWPDILRGDVATGGTVLPLVRRLTVLWLYVLSGTVAALLLAYLAVALLKAEKF